MPSHVANRGGPTSAHSAAPRRGGSANRSSISGRTSRGPDQRDGQVIDIEDDDHSTARGESYKAMPASMATKRSVR